MKKLLTLFALFPLIGFTQTGDIPFQPGAQSAAMGGVQAAITSVWATHSNPGLLPQLEKTTFALGTENRFLLSEMNSYGIAGAVPLKTGTIGLAVTSFGYSLYRRSRVGLAYGLKFSEAIAGGVLVHYDMLTIGQNYGTAGALSASLGFSAKVNDDLTLGAYVYNPFRVRFSENVDEYIPSILSIGGSYRFSDKVLFAADVEKDINQRPGLKVGIEYKPDEKFFIRTGFRTLPQSYTFGFGLELKSFHLDMAAWMHPVLGISPNLSLRYEIK